MIFSSIINKKGFSYLIAVSLILGLMIIIFSTSNFVNFSQKQDFEESRILSANEFVKNLNQDIPRATYISAFRTLIALEEHVSTTGHFLNDTESLFRETFYNGTINGTKAPLLVNSSFIEYLDKVKVIAGSTGLSIDMNVTKITLNQTDPWTLVVGVTINTNLTEKKTKASWEFEKEYLTEVSITDLRDPLYGVYTFNRAPNQIETFNETEFVAPDNSTDNLQNLANNSYYIATPLAPSFLDRFENKTNPNPNGIASLVNINVISDQDLEVYPNRIKVDYMYFNDLPATGSKVCNVQNMPYDTYFVIPSEMIGTYQIENLSYQDSGCP